MTVTFVLPAFYEKNEPHVSLGSLLCQTNPNWKAIVFHNGYNEDQRIWVHKVFNDPRILYAQSTENTGTPTYSRITALNAVVDTEFMVTASIQDYFLPNTVEEILKVAEDKDFIYWNSLNHLFHDNVPLDAKMAINHIDWGNFAVRTSFAKKIGIPFLGEEDDRADGHFAESVLANNGRCVKIDKILTVHN